MRWIVRLVAALAVLVVLAAGLLLLLPADKVALLAAREFGRATGRVLAFEGGVTPSIWPVLGVETGPVSISNAEWSDAGPMLRAEALAIRLDMGALLGGEVRITGISAVGPVLLLERDKDGRGNWQFGGKGGGAGAASGAPFTLDLGTVTGGAVHYTDRSTGRSLNLTGIEAEAAFPSFTGPLDLTLKAAMNGQPLDVTAQIESFGPFMAGQLVPMTLNATSGVARASFKGQMAASPLVAEGTLQADLADLAAVSALAGAGRPNLPEGLGARNAAVSGALTLTAEGSLHLRAGTVTLDGNVLQGDADLTTDGPRPKLSAQVSTGALNLAALAGAPGGGAAATGWSRSPIDVSGLAALDAKVALAADAITLGTVDLGRSRLLLTLDRARAVFDIREIAAYGGSIAGQFVVNGRGGLSVGGDLTAKGLMLQPLLADLAGSDRLIANADLGLKFLGVGNSLDGIAHSLSGNGSLTFGKGELRGLDLAGMLRNLDPNFVGEGARTIFDGVTASYTLKDGVLSNDDLALTAPLVAANGKGRVDIGNRTLDYRIEPTVLARPDGSAGVNVPLAITGPWAKPVFKLDLEALTRQRLADEKAKLEARLEEERLKAEAAAKAALSDRLGIDQLPGESLEDAARRRAQQALESEAARALDGLIGNGAGN
ncbi:AsmA family protein [Rhodobacter ferrooxidans]|uniref:AsmA family protein n=1 Tax=Rhodobacter ferrooxidans TaxID=371731 RepID=C8RZR8_9RHOB|nr:AsmA family protein [Rhodobacter sp. SW2]EEW25865.1 AsmA family protein [Rhodobacter sp. SW2]